MKCNEGKEEFINSIANNFKVVDDEMLKEVYKCKACGLEEETGSLVYGNNKIMFTCPACSEKQKESEFNRIIPSRYLSNGLKECKNKDLLKSDCSILYGGFGTGKTWEAYSIAKKLFIEGSIKDFNIITEAGLINYLKAGFTNNTFEERIEKYKQTDLLIVDEMGKSNDTEFNKSQIFEILNYRYDWMKKTVLICNCLERSELVDILNPAIADRYRECIIHMDGKSKRYEKNQV